MILLQNIKNKAPAYGALPFWSWNDKLEEGELRRQIRRMKELGMNGFFMHARAGLETEYMSEEWFRCVNICIDEAKKLGMEAWAYDENGWPSGYAGGALLQDKKNLAVGIAGEQVSVFPTDEETIAVYTIRGNGEYTYVTGPVDGCEAYLRVYREYTDMYVDTLDAEVTKAFLQSTHEAYKKACGEEFGKTMPGFFTDEPQYYSTMIPYSNTLPGQFKDTYGYDIFAVFPAIFDRDAVNGEKFRYDYYKLVHTLFIHHWVKVVYEWCRENGVKLTGHAVEENTLGEMMESCGGVMPFYEYEDMPGIDYLGRSIKEDNVPKQLGSVCAQLGKKKAISEMFGCAGWDASPRELKRIADMQYANGVNVMCQHLYSYSGRGQRKRDYPLHFSEHNSWQEYLGTFNHYYKHLGAALSEGEEYAPILVIHPIHGTYMQYKNGEKWHEEIETHFIDLSRLLSQHQIPYHYGDENLMKKYASVQGDKIRVGRCLYDTVIVPFTYTLDHETADVLQQYVAGGGKIWLYDRVPPCIDGEKADMGWLQSNITWEDILHVRDVRITAKEESVPALRKMTRRLDDGSSLVFLANITGERLDSVKVSIPCAVSVAEIDLATMQILPVHGETCETGGIVVYLPFEDAMSHLLVVNSPEVQLPLLAGKPAILKQYIPLPQTLTFAARPQNTMTLDTAMLSKDGVHFEDPFSIYGIKDNLLTEKYEGPIWLQYTFTADEGFYSGDLRLILEPMRQNLVTVNGVEVQLSRENGWMDRSFSGVNIAHLVTPGINTVLVRIDYHQSDYVYSVLSSDAYPVLRRSMAIETEIEPAYLVGDFALHTDAPFHDDVRGTKIYAGGFSLMHQKDTIDGKNIMLQGYPFFWGTMHVKFTYRYFPGSPTVLGLTGRFSGCRVKVNGVAAGEMLFLQDLDLAAFLHEGVNEICLEITASSRNLLGPHHRDDPEPMGVSSWSFTFEKAWDGKNCVYHRERYSFVRFGIEGK